VWCESLPLDAPMGIEAGDPMNGRHAAEIAKSKAKMHGWTPFLWQAIGEDAVLITGGVSRPLLSGPRKGKPTWPKPHEQVVVTDTEIKIYERRYEQKTGKCAQCDGTGQIWIGWSAGGGHRYRSCSRANCDGGTLKVLPA